MRYDLADLGLEAHVLNDPWYSCRKAFRAENDSILGPNYYFGPKQVRTKLLVRCIILILVRTKLMVRYV